MMTDKIYWVYILECDNGSYYTGYTDDMEKRYRMHESGKGGARYTRSFRPVGVAGCWKLHSARGTAMKVESFIKSLDRKMKEGIVRDPRQLARLFNEKNESNIRLIPCIPEKRETGEGACSRENGKR